MDILNSSVVPQWVVLTIAVVFNTIFGWVFWLEENWAYDISL